MINSEGKVSRSRAAQGRVGPTSGADRASLTGLRTLSRGARRPRASSAITRYPLWPDQLLAHALFASAAFCEGA